MELVVAVHDDAQRGDSEAHLLAGLVSIKTIECVLADCEHLSAADKERLRTLWMENLRKRGGVPMPGSGGPSSSSSAKRQRQQEGDDSAQAGGEAATQGRATGQANLPGIHQELESDAVLKAEADAIRKRSRYLKPKVPPYGPHLGCVGKPAPTMARPTFLAAPSTPSSSSSSSSAATASELKAPRAVITQGFAMRHVVDLTLNDSSGSSSSGSNLKTTTTTASASSSSSGSGSGSGSRKKAKKAATPAADPDPSWSDAEWLLALGYPFLGMALQRRALEDDDSDDDEAEAAWRDGRAVQLCFQHDTKLLNGARVRFADGTEEDVPWGKALRAAVAWAKVPDAPDMLSGPAEVPLGTASADSADLHGLNPRDDKEDDDHEEMEREDEGEGEDDEGDDEDEGDEGHEEGVGGSDKLRALSRLNLPAGLDLLDDDWGEGCTAMPLPRKKQAFAKTKPGLAASGGGAFAALRMRAVTSLSMSEPPMLLPQTPFQRAALQARLEEADEWLDALADSWTKGGSVVVPGAGPPIDSTSSNKSKGGTQQRWNFGGLGAKSKATLSRPLPTVTLDDVPQLEIDLPWSIPEAPQSLIIGHLTRFRRVRQWTLSLKNVYVVAGGTSYVVPEMACTVDPGDLFVFEGKTGAGRTLTS